MCVSVRYEYEKPKLIESEFIVNAKTLIKVGWRKKVKFKLLSMSLDKVLHYLRSQNLQKRLKYLMFKSLSVYKI